MVKNALAVLALMGAAPLSAAPYVVNQNAAVAVGQADLVSGGVNGTSGVASEGLFSPSGVWSDGTMLIVADTSNNRVKIYNAVPQSSGIGADVVVGQPDSNSSLANQGGAPADSTLSGPTGVFYDGTRLFVADTGNNRVLVYNVLPSSNNVSADWVIGQAGTAGASANQGGAAAANTLSSPSAVWSDGVANIYVADKGNNRVLLYNSISGVNNEFAAYVVGQTSFNVTTSNMGGAVRAFTLSAPAGVWSDGVSLFVADTGNNRVLGYSVVPTTNAVSAANATGQPNLTSNAANNGGITARSLSGPQAVSVDAGGRLLIADSSNNRALIYASSPTVNNAQASFEIGQTSFTTNTANQGGLSASTLKTPVSVVSDNTQLYVVDQGNNRVVIVKPIPTGNNASGTIAVGQSDLVTGTANQASSTPTATGLFRPTSASYDASRLIVADRFNNRVLLFSPIPRASGAAAAVVLGQATMSTSLANRGGAPAANTLSLPNQACSDGTKLYVADQNNNRVLVYNAIPGANGANAAFVLGQSSFTGSSFNMARPVAAFTLGLPSGVDSDGTHLLVADRFNHRVLSYTLPIATNTVSAALELGQPPATPFTTNGANQGGASASSLNAPNAVYSSGTAGAPVFIADTGNNRVLIWNTFPAANGQAANVVIGQPNFTSVAANQGLAAPTAQTLKTPLGVWTDGTSLFIADQGNNRVLVYGTIPTVNNKAADLVIGQSVMTSGKANQGASVAANTLSGPTSVAVDSTTGRMFVADINANRVLEYYPATVSSTTAAGASVTLTSPIGPATVTATLPPLAFGAGTSLTFQAQTGFPIARTSAIALTGTGVGFSADVAPAAQPSQDVLFAVTYRPSDLPGVDPTTLVLARFDSPTGSWVPLPSASAPVNNTIFARTNHFSLFQLMQSNPAVNSPSSVLAFPNPLQPSAGQAKMTFANAPAYARFRIYTLTGGLVKDFSADGAGMASWDATNAAGAKVASGVYFVFVQGNGQKRTLKVAIER